MRKPSDPPVIHVWSTPLAVALALNPFDAERTGCGHRSTNSSSNQDEEAI